MTQLSVLVDNRADTAEAVVSASRVHGGAVASDVAEELAHIDEAAVRALLMSLEELLTQTTAEMRADEIAYAGERAETDQARALRDEVNGELQTVYDQVRTLVEGSAGPKAKKKFGIDGAMPRTLKELVETSNNAVSRLRSADANNDGPLGVLFDADKFADAIDDPLGRARQALEDVTREGREDELAMLERDGSVARWERVYRGTALILQGLFVLVDRADLAERVRPTVRRTKGRDSLPEADPQPADEPQPVADEA